ncbi:hypothetical protein [Effusibacillus pohliae]|uniref:hypothetical protein n=1 Tax=Effusibacillus pohliae TaxID=232270 RepID=UPI0003644B58|nr:hypothetical protein [Effusibacillus pohliae]
MTLTDELYETTMLKARGGTWIVTLAATYILFALVMSGVPVSPIQLLASLLLVHMLGWTVLIIYYGFKFGLFDTTGE